MKDPNLKIYPTPKDIIMAFGGSPEDSRYIREQIDHAGCWGFIEGDTISLYLNSKTKSRDLVELFAHELSHAGAKVLREEYDEEEFCTVNAKLCLRAYDMMRRLKR